MPVEDGVSATADTGPLLFDIVDERIARIRFNRPRARNAVDIETAAALAEAVARVERDPALRCAILMSSTPGTFSAGADLKVVAAGRAAELRRGEDGFAGLVDAMRSKPWIAAVDGPALGGGFELCLACDMIVATPRSTFGLPEVRLGLLAGAGGVYRVARALPRNLALEMVATGMPIDASRAAGFGLVNRLAEPEDLDAAALDLARAVAANAPVAVRESLAVARRTADLGDAELSRLARERLAVVMATDDAREGPAAFVERRAPVWRGR